MFGYGVAVGFAFSAVPVAESESLTSVEIAPCHNILANITIIIKSLVAGFLFTLAVESHNKNKYILSLLFFMGFIVTGCTHCILTVFYYGASSMFYNDVGWFMLQLLLIILFNFIGSVLYNLFVNKSIIYRSIE